MASPFTQTARPQAGTAEVPPAGAHPAVLVGVIDLGTQDASFGDETKRLRKVLLAWELTGEKMSGSARNHVVCRDYTLTFGPKSLLRGVVEKWRGRAFADNEEFDLLKLLGKPCLLTLVHGTSGKGNTYAKIDGISGVPKGLPVPPAGCEPYSWFIGSEGEFEAPQWLPYLYGRPVGDVIREADELTGRRDDLPPRAKGDAAEPAEEELPF